MAIVREGKTLVFYIEPSAEFQADVSETWAGVLHDLLERVDSLETGEELEVTIKGKWFTPDELAKEKAGWVE